MEQPPDLVVRNLPFISDADAARHQVYDFIKRKARPSGIAVFTEPPASTHSAHVWIVETHYAKTIAPGLHGQEIGDHKIGVSLHPDSQALENARAAMSEAATSPREVMWHALRSSRPAKSDRRRDRDDDEGFYKKLGLARPYYLSRMEVYGVSAIVGGSGQMVDHDDNDAVIMSGFAYDPADTNPKNQHWRDKRLEILGERFVSRGFAPHCERCMQHGRPLQLHHKPEHYDRTCRAWEYPNYCFEVLCVPCHEEESNRAK